MTSRSRFWAYGVSLAAIAAALVARVLLDPWLGDRFSFITLFLAVPFAAWYGGKGPALLALVAGAFGVAFFILQPRYTFQIGHIDYQVGLVLYCIVCFASIAMFESLRRNRQQAEQRQQELEREMAARRSAEHALAEREEFMRTTLGSIGDAVLATDASGAVTYLNPVAEELTGWTLAEARGQPLDAVFRIVNEDTLQPVANPAVRALKEGVIVGLANHTILLSRDGKRLPIDDSAAPVRDEKGNITGAVLTFRQVIEQRRVMREREQALATLNSLVASAPIGITILDKEMRFTHINAALADMNGIPAEDHIGKTVAEIVPDVYPQVEPIFRRLMETGEFVADQIIEGETKKSPGVQRVWRESWFPITAPAADKPVGVGVTVQEITEERRAVHEMTGLVQRLTSVVDNTPLALIEWDADFVVTRWSALAEHVFGWTAAEVIGKRLDAFPIVYAEDVGKVQGVMARLLEPDRAYVVSKNRNNTKSGAVIHCEWYNSVLRDEAGKTIAVLSLVLDVTERQRADQALKEADRRKDEFLATLAHELRNPLAPLGNGLQLMRMARGEQGTVERALTMMERQFAQLVRLVDDLMDLSRISNGRIELRKERVELAAVIASALETSRPLVEEMGHELTVTLPPQPITLEGDVTRLAQIFLNLLTNAAKYTDRCGRIWVTAERQGGEVRVSVRDSGIGIAADQIPRLFQMFAQGERSLAKAQGGLGIGLNLVKQLVTMHGGTVEARSDGPGKGSEFIVHLPIVLAASVSKPAAKSSGLPETGSALRILIVDDNRDGADSLSKMLQLMGNDTRTAYDGKEAIDAAGNFRPDVVLLDIGMPKLNGYDACRHIRGQPWADNVVIFAMTGWGQDEDRRRSHEAGFDHHLVKPVEPRTLMNMLASLSRSSPPG